MQIWYVGAGPQRFSQRSLPPKVESHSASQAGLVHIPGSCEPFARLTSEATSISLALPSAFFIVRRKFTYAATGSSAGTLDPSLADSWAHLSTMAPVLGSLTSEEARWPGSEQSSASLRNATTTLAPSRKRPEEGLASASFIASRPCGWRAPSTPTFTASARYVANCAAL